MSASDEPTSWTIRRVLSWTVERFAREGIPGARLDAEVLLAHGLGLERVRLYMDFDKPLRPEELAACRACIQRRLAREPVAYITGTREFWSLPFTVTPAVLIPRPETELLVELTLALATQPAPTIVDVGTGSGAVAVSLARALPAARLFAIDLQPAALEVAALNAQRHQVELALLAGDLLTALPAEVAAVHAVVANLPYVTSTELSALDPEVRDWEPRSALDGGPDGLDLVRRLVPQAWARLASGGALILEIGAQQGSAVARLLEEQRYAEVQLHRDLAGLERAVTARRP